MSFDNVFHLDSPYLTEKYLKCNNFLIWVFYKTKELFVRTYVRTGATKSPIFGVPNRTPIGIILCVYVKKDTSTLLS